MARRPLIRLVSAPALAATLTATALTAAPAQAAPTAPTATSVRTLQSAPAAATSWKPRPEQYTQTAATKDLAIPMSDGVKLRADLTLPANAAGPRSAPRCPSW